MTDQTPEQKFVEAMYAIWQSHTVLVEDANSTCKKPCNVEEAIRAACEAFAWSLTGGLKNYREVRDRILKGVFGDD